MFSHGGPFGGHTLFVKNSQLHDVYNRLGEVEQEIVSDIEVPTGDVILGVLFDEEGNNEQHIATGTATLAINDQPVGQRAIKAQPANSCWQAKVSTSARTQAGRSARLPTRHHSRSPAAGSAK